MSTTDEPKLHWCVIGADKAPLLYTLADTLDKAQAKFEEHTGYPFKTYASMGYRLGRGILHLQVTDILQPV